MNPVLESLKKQLDQYQFWLSDEEERINKNTKDEYLVGLLKVRCNSYRKCIEEITKTIQSFESQVSSKETV